MIFEHTIRIEVDDNDLEEMVSKVHHGFDFDDVFREIVEDDYVECDYVYEDMRDKIYDEVKKRIENKQKLIMFSEVNHGFLGVAQDLSHALDYLYDYDWITAKTEYYDKLGEFHLIEEYFGKNWKELLKEKSIDELNEIFMDEYYFHEIEVQ